MVASASGMGGYGGPPMQKRRLGRLTLVGDFTTDVLAAPPLAPRVTQAAALLAARADGHSGRLLLPKIVLQGRLTLAVALASPPATSTPNQS